MIISKLNDGKIAITIENKEEAVELYTAFNREHQKYAPENAYDVDEIAAETWPKTITEDEVDDNDVGFLIWSEDFWEIIREYASKVEALKPGEQIRV